MKEGGLGIRRAVDLAIHTYYLTLHSVESTAASLLSGTHELDTALEGAAVDAWAAASGASPGPEAPAEQHVWDKPIIKQTYQSLIQGSASVADQAHLTAV